MCTPKLKSVAVAIPETDEIPKFKSRIGFCGAVFMPPPAHIGEVNNIQSGCDVCLSVCLSFFASVSL